MGRRFCGEKVLIEAFQEQGFTHLFGSALLRSGRGDKIFAIVGDDDGLKAVSYILLGIGEGKISLYKRSFHNEEKIIKWFDSVARKKSSGQPVKIDELDEKVLRRLASQAFPGSLFYDIFLNNEGPHLYTVLPPVGSNVSNEEEAVA